MPIVKWYKAQQEYHCSRCLDPIKEGESCGLHVSQTLFKEAPFPTGSAYWLNKAANEPERIPVCELCIKTNSNSRYY